MPPSIATMISRRLGNTGSPQVSLGILLDRLKKTTLKVSPMHYCVALCLFGISPERSRTAYIRIGVKVDANSKRTLFLTGRASVWPARPAVDEAADIETSVGAR